MWTGGLPISLRFTEIDKEYKIRQKEVLFEYVLLMYVNKKQQGENYSFNKLYIIDVNEIKYIYLITKLNMFKIQIFYTVQLLHVTHL